MSSSKEQAFILRINPSGRDKVPEALEGNEIIIGWADAKCLLNKDLSWEEFREIIFKEYYSDDENYRRAGSAAGNMWRFIREMKKGDIVLVPYYDSTFYIAKVTSEDAKYIEEQRKDDTAYRRSVIWLNNKKSYDRSDAYSKIQSRMKTRSTCVDATDLLPEIHRFIEKQEKGVEPDFFGDMRDGLQKEIRQHIQNGVMNERDFERLIQTLLISSGAGNVEIRDYRAKDYGADIVANIDFGKFFSYKLAVQCKYYRPEPPVGKNAVDELIQGMIYEGAEFGWLITSGTIDPSLYEYASTRINNITQQLDDESEIPLKIELIDGPQLASMIIENGLKGMID